MNAASVKKRWTAFATSKKGRQAIRVARVGLVVAIVGYLIYQLAGVGWERLWTSMPRTPWFYLLYVGLFLTLPLTETWIYWIIWGVPFWESFPAMLKKRVYNREVMGYSGEVYLYLWGRRHVALPEREVLGTIKDNVVVSSITSTLVAFGLLGLFFLTGQVVLPADVVREEAVTLAVGLVMLGVLIALGFRFRRAILHLPARVLRKLFSLHLARLLIVQALQVAQWAVVVPEVPLSTWFTFLSAQIIIGRIPLLPSRDLLFIGAGIELAGAVDVSSASIAAMLLTSSVLDKLFNLTLFTFLSAREPKPALPAGETKAAPAFPDPLKEGEAVELSR